MFSGNVFLQYKWNAVFISAQTNVMHLKAQGYCPQPKILQHSIGSQIK